MRTENRVVMLTDIKGFTAATSRQTREENARMLQLHDALLSPVIAAFRGRRVKTIGDAYLVLFEAPTEALLCAAAIQDRLWDHARRAAEADRIDVRIAVAMGDVRLDAGDVFGDAVNLAAKIEGVADPGEVWFSEALHWSLDRARVATEELGWRRLDGLSEEVRLFRLARATAGAAAPPYGGAALDLVAGLAPPEPARLLEAWNRRRRPLGGLGGSARLARAVTVAAALAGAGVAAWWFTLPPADRSLRLGHLDAARAEIDRLAAARGSDDPEVLYLRGRLEAARVAASQGGSIRAAFRDWSRAAAAGHRGALSELAREGRSEECSRRRLAAWALGEARVQAALGPLEEIAQAEPPAPEAANPFEAVRRALEGSARCGAGDLARAAIQAIEAPRPAAR